MDLSSLQKTGFCDVRLWGVRWESDGRDVILALELGNMTRVDLRCTWATNVHIDIARRGKGGPALSWEGSITMASDGTYDVSFDFASDGELSLRCNEVVVSDGS
jgi:hypothetical protein